MASAEELIKKSAEMMRTDPIQGSCLLAIVAGTNKPRQHKLAIALTAYCEFFNALEGFEKYNVRKFLHNPPPRVMTKMLKILTHMEAKGYN